MFRFGHFLDARVLLVLLFLALFAQLPRAAGQSFTMTASPLHPFAVDPGESSWATLTLNPVNGFTGSVSLSCSVAPQLTNPPACAVSPSTVTPPVSGPTVTITTSTLTTPTTYSVTVTGTGTGTNPPTNQVVLNLPVLGVTADYTLTVTTPVTPTSLHAGYSATAIVTITPLNGYTGQVTLSCSQVTPAVTLPPVCTFSPTPVPVTGAAATATLTINTYGPTTGTTASLFRKTFYALGLPLFGMTLVGFGVGRGRKRSVRWIGLSSLCLLAFLALVPACGSSSSTTTGPVGNTPNNTYTITLTGADANGVIPSNTNPTVSLTVD
jgi:hypothetical protein